MDTIKELLIKKIESEGLDVKDVDFVAVGGLGLKLDDFWKAANFKCSIDEVKDNFILVFKDGTWINKHYSRDGQVRFKYHKHPEKPSVILTHPQPQEFLDIL